MHELDERRTLVAHLFVTGFVIAVCGTSMASVPEGSLNYVFAEHDRDLHFRIARFLWWTRWFGVILGLLFVTTVIIGFRRGWYERRILKVCWMTLAAILCWFGACLYFLWPALKIVSDAGARMIA